MTQNSFGQAMYQAKLLYDIEFADPSQFEEIALNAWSLIGNKNVALYRYIGKVDEETLTLELPCNCDIIESVTQKGEDWNYTSNLQVRGDYKSKWTEEYIENRKGHTNPLYTSGHYVNYWRAGNTLYFDKPYCDINILYKGVIVDDEGLPYINDKEMNAIATYVAWVVKFKEAIATSNKNIVEIADYLHKKWLIQADQARTPEYLNQNDFNTITNAKTSWCRKYYGKSNPPFIK